MIASQLRTCFEELLATSDLSHSSREALDTRFESLRNNRVLPPGRTNRNLRLEATQIADAILGLATPAPTWSGPAALALRQLLPVGGKIEGFHGVRTLSEVLAEILRDDDARTRLVCIHLTAAEKFTNSHGFATLVQRTHSDLELTHFVRREASSLLQLGADMSFDPLQTTSAASFGLTLDRSFFERIARRIAETERLPIPKDDGGSEFESEDERREYYRRLGATPRSRYLNLGVDNHVGWPAEPQLVSFDQYELVLMPKTKDHVQSVHIDLHKNRISPAEARTVVNRFLSMLCWCDDHYAIDQGGWSGNPIPVPVSKRDLAFSNTRSWHFHRSIPESEIEQRALALYREALNAEHNFFVSHAVLNYYKVLELKHPKSGRKTQAWINREFPAIESNHRGNSSVMRFLSDCGDTPPGEFINRSFRIAVAHASPDSPSDPDDTTELQRLHVAADVLRLLARRFILNEIGISDSRHSD